MVGWIVDRRRALEERNTRQFELPSTWSESRGSTATSSGSTPPSSARWATARRSSARARTWTGPPRGPCEHRGRVRPARPRRGGHGRVPEPVSRQGRDVPLDRVEVSRSRRAAVLRGRARRHRPQAHGAVPRDPPRGDAGARDLPLERQAAPTLLRVIGEQLGWAAGTFWTPAHDERRPVLHCSASWHAGRANPRGDRAAALGRGEGCPGRRGRAASRAGRPTCPASPTISGSSRRSPTGCTPGCSCRCWATPTSSR